VTTDAVDRVRRRCRHVPPCPSADSADRDAAQIVADHSEQGWILLCNGVVFFDDTGEILPDGGTIGPHGRLVQAAPARRGHHDTPD
jgi:Family of unknown function (DUF5999)